MRQNGDGAQPARPADADQLGLAPDGRHARRRRPLPRRRQVAYTFYGYECPVGASCGARTTTAIIPSDRAAATAEYGTSYFHDPSWVTNTRIFNSGGYGSHINIQDLGTEPYNWVTDNETDLGDAEVTRDGKKLVAVRGYNDSTHIVWYTVNGNVLSGRQASGAGRVLHDRPAGRLRLPDVGARRRLAGLERARRHLGQAPGVRVRRAATGARAARRQRGRLGARQRQPRSAAGP